MATSPAEAGDPRLPPIPPWLLRWWWLPVPIACALAWLDSPSYELVADARFLIAENTLFDHASGFWATLTQDYFYSASGNTIPYWRPFTKLSWHLEALVFGRAAAGVFHGVQVVWHLVATCGVLFLARRIGLDRRWSACAGLLYALHPAMVEPTCLVMARSDVVAGAGVVWSLGAFMAFGESGRRRWLVLHLIAAAVALGSKEIGVIVAPLVTLQALAGPDRRRALLSTAPAWGLLAAYWLTRGALLDASPTLLEWDRRRFGVSAGLYLQGLVPFRLDSGVRSISIMEAVDRPTMRLVGTAWVSTIGLGIWAAVKREWQYLVLLGWIGGSLLPVLLVAQMNVPISGDSYPLADRWLVQAVAASSLIQVMLAARITHSQVSLGLQVMVLAFAAVVIIEAPENHGWYANERTLLELEEARFQATPEEFRTRYAECKAADRAVARSTDSSDWEGVLEGTERVLGTCGHSAPRAYNHLQALIELGRQGGSSRGGHAPSFYFEAAREAGRKMVVNPALDTRLAPATWYLYGTALSRTGNYPLARRALATARKLGAQACDLHIQIAGASQAMGDAAGTASGLEEAHRCSTGRGDPPNPDLMLTAAHWWLRAGDRRRAAPLIKAVGDLGPLPPAVQRKLDLLRGR